MRSLAPSLVALSLVFSTGGVAIVGRADPALAGKSATQQSVAPPATAAPSAELPGQCSPPPMVQRPAVQPTVVRRVQEPRNAPSNKSIVLNTNGYNYPLEGEWHPDPVATPQGVPDGVLPEAREPAPAAPEAK